jgi:hypothetical protein
MSQLHEQLKCRLPLRTFPVVKPPLTAHQHHAVSAVRVLAAAPVPAANSAGASAQALRTPHSALHHLFKVEGEAQ